MPIVEGWTKLTWLFWANGQRDMPVVVRQLVNHKTPQCPSQTLFSFCFPYSQAQIWIFSPLLSEKIETRLFLPFALFIVRYKCLRSETELFLWFWFHKVVIPVWCSAHILRRGGVHVRVLENCIHVTKVWSCECINLPAFNSRLSAAVKIYTCAHRHTQSQSLALSTHTRTHTCR